MNTQYKSENKNSGTINYESYDGGKTWVRVSSVPASVRARRELNSYNQHRIQMELK